MQNIARLFGSLADETRLRILNLLARGELCVCDLTTVLDIGQSKASRHLAHLRNVGLVEDRRNGVWMYYSLAKPNGPTHRRVVEWLAETVADFPQTAADLKALQTLQGRNRRCGECVSGNGHRKSPAAKAGRNGTATRTGKGRGFARATSQGKTRREIEGQPAHDKRM